MAADVVCTAVLPCQPVISSMSSTPPSHGSSESVVKIESTEPSPINQTPITAHHHGPVVAMTSGPSGMPSEGHDRTEKREYSSLL